jgi:hypothetical protein
MDIGQYKESSVLGNLYCNVLHNQYLLFQEVHWPYSAIHAEISYGKLKKNKELRSMSVSVPYRSKINVKTELIEDFTFNEIQQNCKL